MTHERYRVLSSSLFLFLSSHLCREKIVKLARPSWRLIKRNKKFIFIVSHLSPIPSIHTAREVERGLASFRSLMLLKSCRIAKTACSSCRQVENFQVIRFYFPINVCCSLLLCVLSSICAHIPMMMMLNEHKERASREWMKESSENYSNWISFASTPTEKHEIRERRLNFCSIWCELLFQLEEGKFRHTKKIELNVQLEIAEKSQTSRTYNEQWTRTNSL